MDQRGNETKPATTPDCGDVTGGHARKLDGGELKLSPVRCSVPKGIRREHVEYYTFIQRRDGWWRSELPVITYDIHDRYCGVTFNVLFNAKPSRTIVGIAAEHSCLACNKQGQETSTIELMLRVEPAATRPLVFSPLPVGTREKQTSDDPSSECKPYAKAQSMKESWVSEDEVILEGPSTSTTGPLATPVALPATQGMAAPGRYRFVRP